MAETLPSTNLSCCPKDAPPIVPTVLYIFNSDTQQYVPVTIQGPDGARYLEYDGASTPAIVGQCGIVQGVVGPQGPAGAPGASGASGSNAYSALSAGFSMPAYGASVSVSVPSAWMTVGQIVFVQFAGFMAVTALADSAHATLQNPSDGTVYAANAAPATAIPTGATVSAGGIQGLNGNLTGAAGGQLKGNYPNPALGVTTAKGDLLADSGVGGGTASRLAVGSDGLILQADSTQSLGLKYGAISLAGSQVTGIVPVANGGTGASTAAAARTNLGVNTVYTGTTSDCSVFTTGFTANDSQPFTHGLSVAPSRVSLSIVVLGTDGATGWTAGELLPDCLVFDWNNGTYLQDKIKVPIAVFWNSTTVSISINHDKLATGASTSFAVKLMKADFSDFVVPTAWSNFAFRVRAYP